MKKTITYSYAALGLVYKLASDIGNRHRKSFFLLNFCFTFDQ